MAPVLLQFTQVLTRHPVSLTGQFEKAVLVDAGFKSIWQGKIVYGAQAFDVGQHIFCAGSSRWLSQPGQNADLATRPERKQSIQ